ncbi:hypothetical protein P1J78_15865 [Psychromarinibacter sp. C21-152]|uniref:Uncharacterized protein n=1 Tax=Psychromarinibacter sediminicola TaxID=3033385 RepID=A0AAE3NUB7_9RHOB|nr:hypothetical protein [Psychromarinibacter sediminicola]MDF0602217.1 hypothetical protein [Psychromarinibacter sediminicola]
MPHRALAALSLAVAVVCSAAAAQPRLVTNPEICALGPDDYWGEMGMVLTDSTMEEIEYFCEFDPPVAFDWSGDRIETRLGYCNEPGIIIPEVFSFEYSQYEPGVVRVWTRGRDEPTVFTACR